MKACYVSALYNESPLYNNIVLFVFSNSDIFICDSHANMFILHPRYVICKGRRAGTDPTHDFLFDLNKTLNLLKPSGMDVLECVPMSVIQADEKFMDYMIEQNERCVSMTARVS